MLKLCLLSKSINQKKIIVFVLLFLVVFLAIPQNAMAVSTGGEIGGLFGIKGRIAGTIMGALVKALTRDKVISALGDAGASLLNAVIYGVGLILLAIPVALSDIATILFKIIIAAIVGGGVSYTDSPAVRLGWPIVRDLANMFVVLGFVVIGIATILRIRDYEAKKLLPSLIIAALLINFSLLISGIFIDGSNIAIIQFLKTNSLSDYYQQTGIASLAELSDQIWEDSIPAFLMKMVGIAFLSTLSAIVFFLLAFLFLVRIFALWILVILSPLAFVCYVFPFTKNIWSMWWNNFFGWCIIGIPASFFIYIATEMQSKLIPETVELDLSGLDSFAQSFTGVFSFLLPGLFLIVGFLFSLKISAMGAGAAIGAFKWSGGKVMGAGAWGGKKFADKTGLSRAATGAKDMATKGLEGLGLMKPGITTANQQARLSDKDRMNRVNSMSAEQMAREITNPRRGQSAHYDRAAMVKRLAADGKLDLLPENVRERAIQGAMSFGASGKDLITSMQSADISNILNDQANRTFNNEARAEGFKALSKRGDLDLIQGDTNRQTNLANAVRHGARIEEIEKSDYHYGAQNEARRQRISAANTGFTDAQITDAAVNQVLDEHLTSMSHEQLRNIDPIHLEGQIGARRIDRLTPDKINAFQYAPQATRATVKSHFNPIGPEPQLFNDLSKAWNEYNAAIDAGDQASATNRYNEFRRLRSLYMAQNNFSGT